MTVKESVGESGRKGQIWRWTDREDTDPCFGVAELGLLAKVNCSCYNCFSQLFWSPSGILFHIPFSHFLKWKLVLYLLVLYGSSLFFLAKVLGYLCSWGQDRELLYWLNGYRHNKITSLESSPNIIVMKCLFLTCIKSKSEDVEGQINYESYVMQGKLDRWKQETKW